MARSAPAAETKFKPLDYKNQSARQTAAQVRNIVRVYNDAPAETIRTGRDWYPRAHDIARAVGHGDVERGAGVIAALSPKQHWDRNIAQAHALSARPIRGVDMADLQAANTRQLRVSQTIQAIHRKTGEGSAPPALYQEHADAKVAHMAVRERILGPDHPLLNNATANIVRAHEIFEGADPRTVLPQKVKTGNFFRNIADPSDAHSVTVDTHAHDMAMGKKLPWDTDRGLGAVGRYQHFADAYRTATKRVGEGQAHVVQAVTWSHWRDLHATGGG